MFILLLPGSMLVRPSTNVIVHVHVHLNPLEPANSLHIFQNVLHTIAVVQMGRICLTVKIIFALLSFSLFSLPLWLIGKWCCREKLDAHTLESLSGLRVKCTSRNVYLWDPSHPNPLRHPCTLSNWACLSDCTCTKMTIKQVNAININFMIFSVCVSFIYLQESCFSFLHLWLVLDCKTDKTFW